MTFTALPQLYDAILARLRASSAFMALVSAVYDEVPEKPQYAYVVLDEPFETPNRTFGQNGQDATVLLSIYTQRPSTTRAGSGTAGFRPALAIAEIAVALLTDIEGDPLTVDGHDVIDADVIGIDASRESNGLTRRVDVSLAFTLETQP